jgi:outer membrane autotransporter protein
LTNNGLIRATGAGSFALQSIAGFGGTMTVVNNGTIDGQINMQQGDDSLTNNGLLTQTTGPYANGPAQWFIWGSFNQSETGVFAPRVSPDTATGYDQLFMEQGFSTPPPPTLAGTMRAVVRPGLYASTQTYANIFQYCTCVADELTTRFTRVTSTSPFFMASAVYVDRLLAGGAPGTDGLIDSVDLILDRIPFGAVQGLTENQLRVGNALEAAYSLGVTGAAATFFSNLLAATSVNVLDQISGEGTSGTQHAAFGAGTLFNTAMMTQATSLSSGAPGAGGAPLGYAPQRKKREPEAFRKLVKNDEPREQPSLWRAWFSGFGASRSADGQAGIGSATTTQATAGGAFGLDRLVSPDLLVGFAIGGSAANFSVPDRLTSGQLQGGHIGVYGIKEWGALYTAGSLSYSRFDNQTNRMIVGIGPAEAVKGSFASNQISGRFELGWRQTSERYSVTPFVAIEATQLWQAGYTETSTGILALTYAAHSVSSLPLFLGVQFDTRLVQDNGWVFSPFLRLAWVHEFQPDRQIEASLISLSMPSFTVAGARAASDAFKINSGAQLAFNRSVALFGTFEGEFSGRTESYAGSGGLKVSW